MANNSLKKKLLQQEIDKLSNKKSSQTKSTQKSTKTGNTATSGDERTRSLERQIFEKRTGSSTRKTLGILYNAYENQPSKLNELYKKLSYSRQDRTSPLYDAYSSATNKSIGRLKSYGFDVDNINDDWYKNNSWLQDYLTLDDYTNNAKKPGKRATAEQKAAYEFDNVRKYEEQTKKAEQETEALRKELEAAAKDYHRTKTDDEIVAGIDWNKYPTLKKAREYAKNGKPMVLNRAVKGTSDDWAYATLWRALNPNAKGDEFSDMLNSYLGAGRTGQHQIDAVANQQKKTQANKKLSQDATYMFGNQGEPGLAYQSVMMGADSDKTRGALNKFVTDEEQRQLDWWHNYKPQTQAQNQYDDLPIWQQPLNNTVYAARGNVSRPGDQDQLNGRVSNIMKNRSGQGTAGAGEQSPYDVTGKGTAARYGGTNVPSYTGQALTPRITGVGAQSQYDVAGKGTAARYGGANVPSYTGQALTPRATGSGTQSPYDVAGKGTTAKYGGTKAPSYTGQALNPQAMTKEQQADAEKAYNMLTRRAAGQPASAQPKDIQEEFNEWLSKVPAEDQMGKTYRDLFAKFAIEKYSKIESGEYNGGKDLVWMNQEGLEEDRAYWNTILNRLTAEHAIANNTLQDHLNWQPTNTAWGDVFDYVNGLDETNEKNILTWNGYTDADKSRAQNKLNELQGTSEDRRNLVLTNAGSYYQTEYRQREYTPDEAGAELRRADAYNTIFNGRDTYENRVKDMTPDQKTELDRRIDAALNGWDNPYKEEDSRNVTEINRGIRHAQLKLQENEKEQQRRADLAKIVSLATGDGTFDDSMLPEPQVVRNEGLGFDVIVPQGSKIQQSAWYINHKGILTAGENSGYEVRKEYFLTPEMTNTFNKLFIVDQKNGTNNAQSYLDGIDMFLSQCVLDYKELNARNVADTPVLSQIASVASVPMNAIGGVLSTIGSFAALVQNKDAQNSASDIYAITNWVDAFRDEKGENWGDFAAKVFGEEARDYGTLMRGVLYSIEDNLFAMAAGNALGGGSRDLSMKFVQMLMSSEATGSKMVQLLKDGTDPTEAALLSIGDGVIEWITEKYSLETIMDPNMKEMIGNGLSHAKHILKSSAAEGSEELASFVLGHAYDAVVSKIAGHEDEIQDRYWELRETMSAREAEQQVLKELFREGGMETFAGALSGGMMEMGYFAGNVRQQSRMGQEIRANEIGGKDNAQAVVNAALELDAGSQSRQIAEKIKQKTDAGKKVSNAELGKLVQNISLETDENITNAAKTVIEDRAYELLEGKDLKGVDRRAAAQIIANAVANPEEVSRADIRKINRNEALKILYKDFTSFSMTSFETSAQIAEKAKSSIEVRDSVSELMGVKKPAQVDTGSVTDQMANEQEKREALINAGRSADSVRAGEVIVDGRIGTVIGMKTEKSGTGVNPDLRTVFTVLQADGSKKTVEASEIGALDFGTAAIIREAVTNPGLYQASENQKTDKDGKQNFKQYTDILLKAQAEGKLENIATDLAKARRIRMAAYTGQAMPILNMDRGVALEIYQNAAAEHKANREGKYQTASRNAKEPGTGIVTIKGVSYDDKNAWNKKLKDIAGNDKNAIREINVAAEIAKRAGVDVTFNTAADARDFLGVEDSYGYFGWENKAGIGINVEGVHNYNPETKEGSGRHHILVTFGHEMTHWLQRNSLKGYNQLESFVMSELTKNRGEAYLNKRLSDIMEDQDISLEDAMSELVADSCDQILANESVQRHIAETNQNLFTEIKGFVQDLVSRIKEAVQGMDQSMSRDALAMMRSTNELAKVWLGAYDEALSGEIQRAEGQAEETVRNSRSDYSYESLKNKPDMNVFSAKTLSTEEFETDKAMGRNQFAQKMLTEIRKDNNGSTVINNIDTGKNVIVNKDGIKHSIGRNLKRSYDIVCRNIVPIIQNAVAVNELGEREGSNYATLMFGALETKDSVIAVRLNVDNRTNNVGDIDILYSIAKKEIKKEGPVDVTPRFTAEMPITGSPSFKISISDLLNVVKDSRDFAAVFSKDVAEKLGMQRPYDSNISGNLRFSMAQLDSEYMQAVKDGNTERQQELVEQAAKDNGYTMKVYHGTPYGGFTQFRDWSYFTANKEYADRYNHPSQSSTRGRYDAATKPMTYGLFMNPGRVFDTRNAKARELFNKIRMEQGMSELTERGLPDWTDGRDLIDYIEENDLPYDTIILDEGADGGYGAPVVPRGESYVTRSNMVKSADPVTYDNDGNVIPLGERFKKENNDIRFSMAQPVEQVRDLIAVHNMTGEQLMATLTEGGFTAPSIAVVKAKTGHSKFGPISIVFKKDTIDPKTSRKNKVYGTDAWTPTRGNAQIETQLNYEVLQQAQRTIRNLFANREDANLWQNTAENWINRWLYEDQTTDDIDEMTRRAYDNDGIIVAYQIAKGNELEYKYTNEQRRSDLQKSEIGLYNSFLDKLEENGMLQEFMDDMSSSMSGNDILDKYTDIFASSSEQAGKAVEAYRRHPDGIGKRVVFAKLKKARWFQADGRQIIMDKVFSAHETASAIRDNLDKNDFNSWIKDMIGGALGKKGIRNGTDLFTRSGNRRSFEATHMEPTAENIVKAMYIHHDAKGGEAGGATGMMAKGSKEYGSISEIKADKERLQQLDDEEYAQKVRALDSELIDYADELSDATGIDMHTIKEILIEAAGEYARAGKTAARSYLRQQKVQITDEQFNKAIDLMNEAQEIPTGYFEAKPERVVGLDEIYKVILPDDSSQELINALNEAGIEYELSNGTDEDRLRILNTMDDARFSKATHESMDVGAWMMGQTAGSVQTEAERQLLQDYRDLRIRISLSIKRQLDYKEKIRRLESKEAELTPAERNDLMELRNKLEIQQNKQAELEDKLYRVTAADGWAGMMYHNNIVLNDFILGKTQDEVRESVEQMVDQVKIAEKIIAQQAKALRKMADSQAVKAVEKMINKKTLTYAMKNIKKELNSTMGDKELQSRLIEMALKRANGEDISEDARTLAIDMTNRMRGYQNDVMERMRGITITIGPDQRAEMKGNGMTLATVREQLKGTGIKVKYGEFSSLETDTGEGGDLRAILPELPQDIGENSGDALFRFISWAQSMRDTDTAMKQEMVDIDDTSMNILALASTIEVNMNAPEYRKQNEQAAQTRQMADELDQAGKTMTSETDLAGKRAVGMASVLQRDVHEAIRYYNTIARMAAQEEKQKVRKNLIEQLKSENTRKLMQQRDKYEAKMKTERQMRGIAEDNKNLRNQINNVAKRVRKRIMEETDQKNIQEMAKPLARQMLKMLVQHDFVGYRHVLFADRQQLEKTMRALDSYDNRDGKFNPDVDLNWLIVGSGEDADTEMADRAYQALMDIESGLLEYRTAEGLGKITLMDRKAALQKVQRAVGLIWSMVEARSNAEINGRRMLVNEIAMQAQDDMQKSRFKGELTGTVGRALGRVKGFVVNGNTTPEYFFKNLRNKTLSQLYDEYHRAENRNGLEVGKAQRRIAEIAEKYGYKNWDPKKRYTFSLEKGGTVNLTLGEMMSLYATWVREQNNQLETNGPEESFHLKVGGFYTQQEEQAKILGREVVKQRAHKLTEADMDQIEAQMTPEQIAYVTDMVNYMTKDIGALGNEASMRMYGIKKYNEKWYFPLEIWNGVKSRKSDQGAAGNTENRIAHSSFSKRRVNNASNALVIRDFTETAIKHIGQMINYNTFAPAIEFMNRVMNEQLVNLSEVVQEGDMTKKIAVKPENATRRNLRAAFIEAYGREAMDYFDNFQADINGGVVRADQTIADKLLSTFKKSAVAGSLSVAMQQPMSYIRAAMMINPKYLAGALNPAYFKGSKAEMEKYSGVAVIKAMGKFDMNFGQSAQDYMTPDAMKTKGKAAYDKISDITTKLPELADTATWTRMWSAVKMEQKALHPEMDVKSDEFLNIVAERFNDVMRKTQVYDSILVKSRNMRNQHWWMKGITSFMAEPTLTANVLADAVVNRNEAGGKGVLAKAGATFILSAILQALVKGVIGAGRNPQDKKTWNENVMYRFASNFIGEINPFSLIPGYSDLMEVLMKGELSDDAMSVVGKILDAADTTGKLIRGEGNLYRNVEDSVGQLAQLFTNIPTKNLMRDARAMWNYFVDQPYAKRENSQAVLYYQLIDLLHNSQNLTGVINTRVFGSEGWETTNKGYYKRMYNAEAEGKDEKVKEMMEYLKLARGTKEKTITSGLQGLTKEDKKLTMEEKIEKLRKQGMKDNDIASWVTEQYKNKMITREEAEKYYQMANKKKSADDAYFALERTEARENGEELTSSSDYFRLDAAMEENNSTEVTKAVNELKLHGYKQDDIEDHMKSTIIRRYKDGEIKRGEAEGLLQKYRKDMTKDDIWYALDRIDFKNETGAEDANGYYYRLKYAIENGNSAEILKQVKDLNKRGKDAKAIKNALSSAYRQKYIDADVEGRRKIQNKLVKAYVEVGISSTEAVSIMQNWVLNAKK